MSSRGAAEVCACWSVHWHWAACIFLVTTRMLLMMGWTLNFFVIRRCDVHAAAVSALVFVPSGAHILRTHHGTPTVQRQGGCSTPNDITSSQASCIPSSLALSYIPTQHRSKRKRQSNLALKETDWQAWLICKQGGNIPTATSSSTCL